MNSCPLSSAELTALRAYVEHGSVKRAAFTLGLAEGTVKQQLRTARLRTGRTTEQLVYEGTLHGWLRVRAA